MSSNEPEQIPGLTDAKLRALAEFAAGAGHEINNPVATIAGYVQQLLPGEQDPDRIQILETIGAQAYRIRDMIGDIMLFARPPQPRPVIQNLAAVVEEVCGAFAAQAGRKQLQIDCSIAPALTILADAAQIRVLLSELLRNALDAAVPRGRIVLEGGQIVDSGRAFARLTIADDGRGIPDAVLPHLFDPFFSGRQAGRGLGFGLAKAWRIATLHAATLTAESPAERGAVFTLKWPLES